MASHPAITPLTFDFGSECMSNESLSGFFEEAARSAPSLLIFEDLDRAFVVKDDRDQRARTTLQHFLNCLDGIGTQDGLIMVATANDPSTLDAAILKRPGRFDRVVAFRPPERDLCVEYLHQIGRGTIDPVSLTSLAGEAAGLSFAQLRESYILAGQLAFDSQSSIGIQHLQEGLNSIRAQMREVKWSRALTKTGFATDRESGYQ